MFLFAGKVEPTPHTSSFNMGYLVSPYPYHNGTAGPIPVSMVSTLLNIQVRALFVNEEELRCWGFVIYESILFSKFVNSINDTFLFFFKIFEAL